MERKKIFKILIPVFIFLVLLALFMFFFVRGQQCGGFAGISCPPGYYCDLEGDYPDASGVCRKKAYLFFDFLVK